MHQLPVTELRKYLSRSLDDREPRMPLYMLETYLKELEDRMRNKPESFTRSDPNGPALFNGKISYLEISDKLLAIEKIRTLFPDTWKEF